MKRLLIASIIILVALPFAMGRGPGGSGSGNDCSLASIIQSLPYSTPDEAETTDLMYMREEEKLARDVYYAMDDLWGLRVFRNIAQAEQKHMDATLAVLNKYGLDDPAHKKIGRFNNPDLQALYDQLIDQGGNSLVDALLVGATIEDVDIMDLHNAMDRADNADILTVYQNLTKGSRNHMRAFNDLLVANDVTYTPQFITQVEFDEITTSSRERGVLDAYGDPIPDCAGSGRGGRGGGRRNR